MSITNSNQKYMSLLFETIKIKKRVPLNLEYHNKRMNSARKELFNSVSSVDLNYLIKPSPAISPLLNKCRVVYRESIEQIEFLPYSLPKITRLILVNDDNISYPYKYIDRTVLNQLKSRETETDILIVKNGLITDTSFSNIALFNGKDWITPAKPLLRGTKRQKYIDMNIIFEENIKPSDLKYFTTAILLNAMLDFEDAVYIDMNNIV